FVPLAARYCVRRHGGYGPCRRCRSEKRDGISSFSRPVGHRRPGPRLHGNRAVPRLVHPPFTARALATGRCVPGGAAMNEKRAFAVLHNGQAIPRSEVPDLPIADFRQHIVDAVTDGKRVAALFGDARSPTDPVDLYVVLADN